jgi:hypothetical protein
VQNGAESVLVDTAWTARVPLERYKNHPLIAETCVIMTSSPTLKHLNGPQQRFYLRNCLIVNNNVICSFFHQTDINSVKHR